MPEIKSNDVNRREWFISSAAVACATQLPAVENKQNEPVLIKNARRLPSKPISAVRTPLGIPEDYKPWITRLNNGDLLITCFHAGRDPFDEHAVFWRSTDDGKTWSKRMPRKDIVGREFAVTQLTGGTIVMTCHFLTQDARNQDGYPYSKLFHSHDDGKTWKETRVGPDGFPEKRATNTDRNVFELPNPNDSDHPIACVGISTSGYHDHKAKFTSIWKSIDGGDTWDKSWHPDTDNWDDFDGFFGQSYTYRSPSGKMLHVVRVDRRGKYWKLGNKQLDAERGDQGDRMMIWKSMDSGETWRRLNGHGDFGGYGEMYPRFLKLKDGRLLLTFTVRSNSYDGHPLGLRGLISYDDGDTWDFENDRIIIDYKNQGASGGGYGNTVQLEDGSLVSTYSYRGEDNKTHIEAIQWKLPPSRTL
ncbi:MAG: sialidase family protein [Planctomycetota bacterium]|nr:sialidase family protein [Planctomycetota bacterium]